MSWLGPNLARRPFVNLRPVHRTAAALAALALLLTAWNVFTYERAGSGAAARAAAIAELERESGAARARLATIEADLARRDLEAENRRAAFLNARIEERSFSWNQLFDRLAEALPAEVRVRSLSPRVAGERAGRRSGAASVRTPVELRIAGEAEDDEALLVFVDRLFAHPSFARPNLQNESRLSAGGLAFTLSVTFYPEPPAAPEAEEGESAVGDGAPARGAGESS